MTHVTDRHDAVPVKMAVCLWPPLVGQPLAQGDAVFVIQDFERAGGVGDDRVALRLDDTHKGVDNLRIKLRACLVLNLLQNGGRRRTLAIGTV